MKTLSILFALAMVLLGSGCTNPRISGVSAMPVRKAVAVAGQHIDKAKVIARALPAEQAAPLAVELEAASIQLATADTEISALQTKIDDQATQFAATSARMLKAERLSSERLWLLWKWRLIAGFELALFVAYFLGRSWLRVQFPLISRFLP